MDALVMDGQTLASGAVAAVRNIANPVRLSRLVMEKVRRRRSVGAAALLYSSPLLSLSVCSRGLCCFRNTCCTMSVAPNIICGTLAEVKTSCFADKNFDFHFRQVTSAWPQKAPTSLRSPWASRRCNRSPSSLTTPAGAGGRTWHPMPARWSANCEK